ncbi:Uncharacterised protein [Bordetella pertussis]|nr:Uncharacterised protein [Bordetella pertussis]
MISAVGGLGPLIRPCTARWANSTRGGPTAVRLASSPALLMALLKPDRRSSPRLRSVVVPT